MYVGFTVDALFFWKQTRQTQDQETVWEWHQGTIAEVTDALCVDKEVERGIFFLVRCTNLHATILMAGVGIYFPCKAHTCTAIYEIHLLLLYLSTKARQSPQLLDSGLTGVHED